MTKVALSAAVLACLAVSPAMYGDTWNKKTKVTFNSPFQIPAPHTPAGVLSLAPGTYVFKLLDSSSNRHIVQVTNERENKVFSTILAINDYRLNASSKTIMYFSERKAGTPMAIKSWFYPGDNFGQRFVYPKAKATEIAVAVNQPVPSYTPPAQVSVDTVEQEKANQAEVYLQTPAKQEVPYEASALAKTDAVDTNGEEGQAVRPAPTTTAQAAAPDAPTSRPLPRTASPIFAVGGLGTLLVGASLLIRRAASHIS
jgi:hypothetical protein